MADADPASRRAPARLVWDIPTRLFHWIIVGLVAFSWWTAEEGRMEWHRWSGLTAAGLLIFRIYWGFFGSKTARFGHFLKGPNTIGAYTGSLFKSGHVSAFGHNPLGGLSVAAMLLALVAQVTLGLFAVDVDGLEFGPLARFVSFDAGRLAAELHETTFNVLLVLIGLHIAAIAFYLLVKRMNLIGSMITGRATNPDASTETLAAAPFWRVALGVIIAVAAVYLIAS